MGFSKMLWQDAVRRSKAIPVAQRLVIAHIGATANPEGCNAWRANDTVVEELGVSPDTVKRARAAAIQQGLWVVSKAAPRSRGSRKTHEYRLLMPVHNAVSGGSSAPTNGAPTHHLVGAAEPLSGCSGGTLVGAAECTPSVISSGIPSGERGAPTVSTVMDTLPAVPDHALSQEHLLEEKNIFYAEIVDEPHDPEPPEFCDEHQPHGPWKSCRDCTIVWKARNRWKERHPERFLSGLFAGLDQGSADLHHHLDPQPSWGCNWCRDTGLIILSDGTPGSQPAVCHHDGTRHPATDEELAALKKAS